MDSKASKPVVMFVDDEPRILKSIQRVVRNGPYDTRFVEAGAQAIKIMQQTRVQVIVSDLQMPEMDGFTLLKNVQKHYPETIRVVLSAITDLDKVLEAVHTGDIYRYITKPYDERELLQTIRQALDIWQVRKEKRDLQVQLAKQNRLLEDKVKLRTAQLMAIERQAELGRYAAQIVHNLKNPMQAISGQISLAKLLLAQGDASMEDVDQHLDRMEAALDNLAGIVSGILRHAKNSAQFDNEWTQLNQVIENELQFFNANDFFRYKVEKHIHLDSDLPPIWANPLHLQQIVDNLINNALDAMESSHRQILTVTTHTDKRHVVMTVSDTGIGIDPANLPFIYQPDFTTKTPEKGTGLGLASVKTMVESYGGSIDVQNNNPQGAKFVVSLPLREINPTDAVA